MTTLTRYLLARGLMALVLGDPIPALAEMPAWVLQRPVVADHAIGIGSAEIDASGSLDGARHRAFAGALGDIARQVSVEVSAATGLRIREDAAGLEQAFAETVASMSRASLPGVEIVDTWSDGGRIWVYARFDLERHRQRLEAGRQRLEAAVEGLARPGSPVIEGLAAGVRALAAAPEGPAQERREALITALHRRFAALEFTDVSVAVAAGAPWLQLRLCDHDTGAPVSGAPVRFLSAGMAPLTVWTDAAGIAQIHLAGLAETQLISVRVDPAAWLSATHPAGAWLRSLPQPAAHLELRGVRRAARLTVTVDAESPVTGLAQDVADILSAYGLDVTDGETVDPSLHVDVRVRARRGNPIAGIHFAFVDVSLTVDAADGQRLYATMAPRIKGAGSSFAEAVRAALHNPCVRFGEAAVTGREVRVRRTRRRRSSATPTPRTGAGPLGAAAFHAHGRT